jgi:hypothetical protein
MSAATPADLSVGATVSFAYTPANCTNCTKEALNVSADLGLASQTISFGALSNTTYGSASFTLNATGGSSGNAVTYALGSGSVGCSLSGTDNATVPTAARLWLIVSITGVTGVGEKCIIVASQAGNTTYEAATSVTRDFTIAKASQTISFGALSNTTYGAASSTLTATGGGSGNPVTYLLGAGSVGCSLSGTNNATVSITGVTGVGEQCVIVASQAGRRHLRGRHQRHARLHDRQGELTVTADNQTITYADQVPQLTYQIAGFGNDETRRRPA